MVPLRALEVLDAVVVRAFDTERALDTERASASARDLERDLALQTAVFLPERDLPAGALDVLFTTQLALYTHMYSPHHYNTNNISRMSISMSINF